MPLWKTVKWFVQGLSLIQAVLMAFVLDDSLGFHQCIGKEEGFRWVMGILDNFTSFVPRSKSSFYRYNLENFYKGVGASGLNIKGPIWRPLRLIMNLIFLAFMLIVPIFYGLIFR